MFADLGLPDADELQVKADLTIVINEAIRRAGWTQAVAAERAGLTQPEVSRLGQMKTDWFSEARLRNVLRRLGVDVEITLHRREDTVSAYRCSCACLG